MILTDGVHLVSDVHLLQLHDFAWRAGLKLEWFQDRRLPHYDLTTTQMAARVERMGAQRVSRKELVRRMVRS